MREIVIAVRKEVKSSQKIQLILLRKTTAQQNHKVEAIVYLLSKEYGSVEFACCIIRSLVSCAPPVRHTNWEIK